MLFTSRSAFESYVCSCQLYRYLRYEFEGTGIQAVERNWHLDVGTFVHEGVAVCLRRIQTTGRWSMRYVQEGIEVALDKYEIVISEMVGKYKEKTAKVEMDDATEYYIKEARCLIAGLIWCWGKMEAPIIAERFYVLTIEQDKTCKVSDDVGMDFKVDAVFMEKDTTDAIVYLLKTMGRMEYRQEKSQPIAFQTFTETFGAKKVLRKLAKENKKFIDPVTWKMRYCNLIKGNPKYNEDLRRVETESGLVRGWKKKANTRANGPRWTAEWQYKQGEIYKNLYAGGYDKFNIWRLKGGVVKWLEMIEEEQVAPGYSFFMNVVNVPVMRQVFDFEIDQVMAQLVEVEKEIDEKKKQIKGVDITTQEGWQKIVEMFRENRRGCYWPTECEMTDFCQDPSVRRDPFGNPTKLYQIREPHHIGEKKRRLKNA